MVMGWIRLSAQQFADQLRDGRNDEQSWSMEIAVLLPSGNGTALR